MMTERYRRCWPLVFGVIPFAVSYALVVPHAAQADSCVLATQHAGVAFPVEKLEDDRACPLKAVIDNYTTANKLGPLRTPLPEGPYTDLLDRPGLAAALVNRLGYAPYQASTRGPQQYWGNDGEGMEGLIELVYRDRTSRIYILDGSYVGTWLPRITGRAVVLVRMNPIKESDGSEAMDTTLVCYTRLNNRVLSGVVSLLRPLIGSNVTKRLMRVAEAANRLSQEMKKSPDRVLEKALATPPLPEEDIALLKRMLAELHEPGRLDPKNGAIP